jgi:Domain of unknown function (DUF4352)
LSTIGIVKPNVRLLHKRMQSKPIAAIIVLSLVVASLVVTGCTTQTSAGAINATAKATTLPSIDGTNVPKAGYEYVGYSCTVKNVDANDRSISYLFWTLRDTEGNTYTPLWFPGDVSRLNQFDGLTRSQPDDIVKGNVIYEVPKNATLKSLTYDDGSSKIVVTL